MATATAPRTADLVRRPRRSLRFTRDDELVRLVRCGDEPAFEAIYDRHHRGILAFCRHMVGSREEGEDAVQHTFAAAYRDLTTSDKPIQLKAWLYTIARNRCLSILRARKEQVSIEDAEPATEGLSSEVQRREDLRDMLRDLQQLPEDQRAALVLSELGALSHEEVAMSLGVRKDKVKALVFQARESLASSRTARETDCREIQEQLSVLRGGALRRTAIRRHVEQCPACAAFKAEVQRQRSAMAVILPVVPTVGLRETVLAAVFGGGGIAGGGAALGGGIAAGGGLLAASGAKGLAAKVLTIAAVAGGATGGGLAAIDHLSDAPADPRDPLALAPPEDRAVKLVAGLRDKAQSTASARLADLRGARPAAAGSAGRSGERGATASAGEGRGSGARRARAKRPAGNGTIRRSGTAGSRPLPNRSGASAAPASAVAPAPQTDAAGGGGPDRSPNGKALGHGPKPMPPGQQKRADRGKPTPPGQRQRQRSAPAPLPAPVPQAAPDAATAQRGNGKGNNGNGNGNGNGGEQDESPKAKGAAAVDETLTTTSVTDAVPAGDILRGLPGDDVLEEAPVGAILGRLFAP